MKGCTYACMEISARKISRNKGKASKIFLLHLLYRRCRIFRDIILNWSFHNRNQESYILLYSRSKSCERSVTVLHNAAGNFHFRALLYTWQRKNTTQSTLGHSEPLKPFYHLEYIHIPYLVRMQSVSLFCDMTRWTIIFCLFL